MCSTFTRGAKPATRRVADGERMNPREGWRVRANARDDEHQGDEDLENSSVPGAAAPHPAAYGLSPPLFQPLTAYAARGRILPAAARENPHPGCREQQRRTGLDLGVRPGRR